MVNDNIKKQKHNEALIALNASRTNIEQQRELRCLADNVYYEAAHEPKKGMMAVAFVTINRVKHKSFPDTVCEVVHQKRKKTCEFSWVCGVSKGYNRREYTKSIKIANKIYRNHDTMYDVSGGSIYFKAVYAHNKFFDNLKFIKKIGKHQFYRDQKKQK